MMNLSKVICLHLRTWGLITNYDKKLVYFHKQELSILSLLSSLLSILTHLPLVAWGLIALLWANLTHYESKEVIRNLNIFSPKN